MPKISQAHRDMRKAQILGAAWRCFYREGVQATTMEQIIRESGLSASAMYRYFSGKQDIILNAITHSLTGVGALLAASMEKKLAPTEWLRRVTQDLEAFSRRDGFDLSAIAMCGWSEAQRDEKVRMLIRDFYLGFRRQLAEHVRRWQATGELAKTAKAEQVARVLQSTLLGYVVQMAIMRDVTPAEHAKGFDALLG